ncbi:MAG: tetraacyldisaccharide 4'-kinase, partial [Candidatus Caenarcaniphilales bacterium]|nr:tetraacyldisaccharide 4'-kinase [Candidatus Caenarcaniphilales bacterium]
NFQANSIEVSFGVYHDRYSAAQKILEQEQIDIFILDDGKQHLKLEKDFDLTLINASETGFYREFDWNSDHCIKIYTKVDEAWQKQNPEKFSIRFNLSLNKILDTTKVVGVFTGIADHKSLIKMIKNLIQEKYPGLINKPLTEWVFPDHHFFDLDEVTEVSSLGINLITTRKDLARIPKGFHDKFIVADLSLETNPENLFDRILG